MADEEVALNQPGITGVMASGLEAAKAAGYRVIRQLDPDTYACWEPGFGPPEPPAAQPRAPSAARGTSSATAAGSTARASREVEK